jgi:membrane fusion protein (multidrug efflux system)
VVQRLPVRIALDPAELARHPLRVGVSMTAKVYLGDPPGQAQPALPGATGPSTQAVRTSDADNGSASPAPLLRPAGPRTAY